MQALCFLVLSLCLLPKPGSCEVTPALPRGHVFFASDFEGADALQGWSGTPRLGPGRGSVRSLFFERPAGSPAGSSYARLTLPAAQMRGYLVYVAGMVKAENVSEKPQSWNGIKLMLPMTAGSGKLYPQATIGVGTFDWQRFVFPVRVPDDATEIALHLGLEAVTGRVWFDDIKITVRKPPFVVEPRVVQGPAYKGHDLPRLRGAMVSSNIDEESLRVLGQEWNANLIRWQLTRPRSTDDPLDLAAYDRWLEGELKKLDAALPLCERYGLRVVIDLHSPPGGKQTSGGYAGSSDGLFSSAACQAKFVEVWQRLARRYRGARAVWGYDLANEPVENVVDESLLDWAELAEKAARAIRAIDAGRTIIVEPPRGGGPNGLDQFRPLDVPNVVYSIHMYLPHAFTHQGVTKEQSQAYRYPGEIDGKRWDKAQLEAALQPAIAFQKNYGVHLYIGEFSAIRWAPDNSAYRYLKDLIDIFEAHGWDWSYHAFREWQGWSVEHGADRAGTTPAAHPTDREKLLRGWFARDKKPAR
jgi:endoglucanase